jgi:hypothetical protein
VNTKHLEVGPLLNVIAAFTAGAVVTYMVGDAMLRRRDAPPTNAQLRDLVRARLADLVSYPDAIEVDVDADGRLVHVSGHVLASELDRLLSQLTQVTGVYKVYNALVSLEDEGEFGKLADQARAG